MVYTSQVRPTNPHFHTSESLVAPCKAVFGLSRPNRQFQPVRSLFAPPQSHDSGLRRISLSGLLFCKFQSMQTSDTRHDTELLRPLAIEDTAWHSSRRFA